MFTLNPSECILGLIDFKKRSWKTVSVVLKYCLGSSLSIWTEQSSLCFYSEVTACVHVSVHIDRNSGNDDLVGTSDKSNKMMILWGHVNKNSR